MLPEVMEKENRHELGQEDCFSEIEIIVSPR